MNPWERQIANIAIRATHATTVEQLTTEISEQTGIAIPAVNRMMNHMLKEGFVNLCVTPARNVADSDPSQGTTLTWYEKGERWQDS
jgi:hypothetical protein